MHLTNFLLTIILLAPCEVFGCDILNATIWYGTTYHNVSELGQAAWEDRPYRTRTLVEGGCDVNYAGVVTVFKYNNTEDEEVEIRVDNVTALHMAAGHGSMRALRVLSKSRGIELDA